MTNYERNREYKLAYQRGYQRGIKGGWPDHRPPSPPDELVARLMDAARALRDGVDGELATLDGDDPWTERLGPLVDAVDESLARIGQWIKRDDEQVQEAIPPPGAT